MSTIILGVNPCSLSSPTAALWASRTGDRADDVQPTYSPIYLEGPMVSEDFQSLIPRENSQKGFCLLDRMSQSEHLSFVVSDVKLLMTLHLTKNQEKGRMSCNSSLFHNIKPAMLMPPWDSLKPFFCRSGDTAASSSSSGRSLPRALDLTWGLRCGTAKACVTWNTQCLGKRHANLKGESIGFWRFLQMIPKNHGF